MKFSFFHPKEIIIRIMVTPGLVVYGAVGEIDQKYRRYHWLAVADFLVESTLHCDYLR